MKGSESIFFFMAWGFFVIGTHQALIYSISEAYGIFVFSLGLLFAYAFKKGRRKLKEEEEEKARKKSKKKPSKKKR
ncbi:MAG: hypothetical protein R8G66_27955 [Cytophagales bacterium]|nr:hypothetical protein [Cytophagales bacterium]